MDLYWKELSLRRAETAVGCVVDNEGGHMMLECGTGVVAVHRVQAFRASNHHHLHPDHSADLFPLGFAILHSAAGLGSGHFLSPGLWILSVCRT